MNRRTLLAAVTALLGLSGLAVAAWPFLASMGPSAAAGLTLPHLPVEGIGPGEYAFFDSGFRGLWRQEHYLVIRQFDGSYNVLVLEKTDYGFIMPDTHFWGISGFCRQLSLPPPRGRLVQGGDIRCLDANMGELSNERWQWTYTGKNVSGHYGDFLSPQFVVEAGQLVVGKWRWPKW